jgi:hypothetical protein
MAPTNSRNSFLNGKYCKRQKILDEITLEKHIFVQFFSQNNIHHDAKICKEKKSAGE